MSNDEAKKTALQILEDMQAEYASKFADDKILSIGELTELVKAQSDALLEFASSKRKTPGI